MSVPQSSRIGMPHHHHAHATPAANGFRTAAQPKPLRDDGAVEGEGEVVAEVEVEGGAEEEEEEDGEEQDEGGEEEAEEAEGGAEQEDAGAAAHRPPKHTFFGHPCPKFWAGESPK